MKFYLNYNAFLEVLAARKSLTVGRSSFNVLKGNIDVIATEEDNCVSFKFTDLDNIVVLTYDMPKLALVLEGGRALVQFQDIVKTAQKCKWKDGEANYALFDSEDDGTLTTSLGGRWQPKIGDLSDYPDLDPAPDKKRGAYTVIRTKDLVTTAICASEDETRKDFTGVLVDETGGLCATDGHRLFHWEGYRRECGDTPWRGIIARTTIALLGKLYEPDDLLSIEPTDDGTRVIISTDSNRPVRVIARLVKGVFPDFTKVIPKTLDNRRRILNPAELLKRLRLEAKVIAKTGTMCVTPDGEAIKALPDNGGRQSLGRLFEPAEQAGASYLAVNINYLADAIQQLLDATGADTLVWEWVDEDMPAVLRAADTTSPTAVVMPMQW